MENFTFQYLMVLLSSNAGAKERARALARVLDCSGFYSEAIHAAPLCKTILLLLASHPIIVPLSRIVFSPKT
jgi:hypothetical protein